ncbi:hypothetical protein [Arthrobacter oryzae]|uniref:hypothetical protein n=1 Tax=Arthrobacter oryzae TaxID=409290 RepID=UPI0027879F14|nr:hypothetical protein [Arthrobacter oryzae]MDQ0077668.1 hypothetical protein [Arthrobacter oryzae]
MTRTHAATADSLRFVGWKSAYQAAATTMSSRVTTKMQAMTAHAFSALDAYIYGLAKQEKGLPFDSGEQAAAMAQLMLANLRADEYPHLAELTSRHVLQPG